MAEYIERDKVLSYAYCPTQLTVDNPLAEDKSVVDVQDIEAIPTADVAEVKHGEWHILPEDPYDESGCPTEEGWYRIITYDGEEMTDYYFAKPTLTGIGFAYWKDCKKEIRAWAKMDE